MILSLLTAFFYSLSNVLELMEAEQVPDEYALNAGLMARLVKKPRWWLGLFSDVLGFVSQAGALALAAVVFVEPILASGILMALFVGAALTHRPVERTDLVAAGVMSGGLAVFLYEVSPTGGIEVAQARPAAELGLAFVGLMLVCIAAARGARGPKRAAFLGVASGISFGMSAVFTKALVHYLGEGVFAWIPHWEPYALAVTAIGGVVIAQSSLQTGALAASVATTEATGPIAAACLGLGLLHERFTVSGPLEWLAVILSIAAMLWAISELARAEERMLGADAIA